MCERVKLEYMHGKFTINVSATDEQKYNDKLKINLANEKIHCCLK